jgi:hypothetical protein
MDKKEKLRLWVPGKVGQYETVTIGADRLYFFYGSKAYVLPFKIKLNDFIAQNIQERKKLLFV